MADPVPSSTPDQHAAQLEMSIGRLQTLGLHIGRALEQLNTLTAAAQIELDTLRALTKPTHG